MPVVYIRLIHGKWKEAATAEGLCGWLLRGPRSGVIYLLRVLSRQSSHRLWEGKLDSIRKSVEVKYGECCLNV
jgi:hypothetical protein